MYVVLLRFAAERAQAARLMEGHRRWLSKGFEDGVFVLSGSLQPDLGGAILAHHTTRAELDERIMADPFVAANVVAAEVLEIAANKAVDEVKLLLS